MGLSTFEQCSIPPPYCRSSMNRSLTTLLIEASDIPSKSSSSHFAHTPEWADGMDIWSSSLSSSGKSEISRRHFDFHRDLGLYLPRHEKPNSAPTSLKAIQINSKITTNHFPPERIRQLLRKEKDLLLQNDFLHQPTIIDNTPLPTNTLRQSTSLEISSTNEIRLPLRHTAPESSSPPTSQPQPQLNQDTLKTLLKEHLTSLLTRGATTINADRSLGNDPSIDTKQKTRTESKLIEERFSKSDESTSTQQIKTNQTSLRIFHQRSTLGLTVTPLDLASQRHFASVSLEKMAQQRNLTQDSDSSSIVSSRPPTQPVAIPPPPPTYLYQQQQRVVLKRNLETINSSSGDIITSNENSNQIFQPSQPIQNMRKAPSHHRSSSNNGNQRSTVPTTTTIELLPPIISGKRLHIPIANHRYL